MAEPIQPIVTETDKLAFHYAEFEADMRRKLTEAFMLPPHLLNSCWNFDLTSAYEIAKRMEEGGLL